MCYSLRMLSEILSSVFPCGCCLQCLIFLLPMRWQNMDSTLLTLNLMQRHGYEKVRGGDSQGVRVVPEVLLVPANRGAPRKQAGEMRQRMTSHLWKDCWIIEHVQLHQVKIWKQLDFPNVLEDTLQSQWGGAEATSPFFLNYIFPTCLSNNALNIYGSPHS